MKDATEVPARSEASPATLPFLPSYFSSALNVNIITSSPVSDLGTRARDEWEDWRYTHTRLLHFSDALETRPRRSCTC